MTWYFLNLIFFKYEPNVLLTSADNTEYVVKKQALSFPQQFLSEILKFNALFEVEEKLHENSLLYISIKPSPFGLILDSMNDWPVMDQKLSMNCLRGVLL